MKYYIRHKIRNVIDIKWAKSDIPICACFGRLDVRQANMAYYSVEGFTF